MKRKTYKKIIIMYKKIYEWMFMGVLVLSVSALCTPCLLIFSVGKDGELTIWNFVGLAWGVILYKLLFKNLNQ